MLNRMISRIALAAGLSMLGCFGRAAEPLKIGIVAPLTGPAANPDATKHKAQSSLPTK
jgi:hypothetical protein